MKYKRSEIMGYGNTEYIRLIIAGVMLIIIGVVVIVNDVQAIAQIEELSSQNAEYLSVIEEYSIKYSELEDEAKGYKGEIKDYKKQIKDYKAQVKEYKEKLETATKATTTKKTTTTKTSTSNPSSNSKSFKGNITAYCGCSKCCGKWATNDKIKYGASGMKLVSGYSVASDYYPMGTILYIEGYGNVQVADRFGAGHGQSRIDMYFDSHSRALQWGRQYKTVTVVSK